MFDIPARYTPESPSIGKAADPNPQRSMSVIHGAPLAAHRRVRSQLPHLNQLGSSVIREVEMGWRK